jgi:hypothetical protein
MRIRAVGAVALWVIMAFVGSAVTTCVPVAMHMQASHMPSCAGMDGKQPSVSCDGATDCCTHHEPALTAAKAYLLKTSLPLVSPWLDWIARVVIVPTTLSITTAESPPDLTSILGPPAYIVLSTLRV